MYKTCNQNDSQVVVKKTTTTELKDSFFSTLGSVIEKLIQIFLYSVIIGASIVFLYEMPSISGRGDIESIYTPVVNNIYVQNEESAQKAEKLDEFIEDLPDAFVKEFRNNWVVTIGTTAMVPIGLENDVNVGGYTTWKTRTVFINDQYAINEMMDIFVHEIGHCFDFEYGMQSYSKQFETLYNAHKDTFVEESTIAAPGYSTSTNVEFFAASFKEYLLHGTYFKARYPDLYKFFDVYYNDVANIKYFYMYDFGDVANLTAKLGDEFK